MPLGVALKIWYTESKRVQRGGKSMEIPNPTEEKAEEKPIEQTEKPAEKPRKSPLKSCRGKSEGKSFPWGLWSGS